MKRIATALVLGTGVVLTTAVIAADDPVANRQAIMKNTGAAMGVLGNMAKGEVEFDQTTAQLAFRVINAGSMGYGELFPEGSEGGDSRAAEAIWSDMESFQAIIVSLQGDTAAAIENPPDSVEALGPLVGAVGENCGECHEKFRIATN